MIRFVYEEVCNCLVSKFIFERAVPIYTERNAKVDSKSWNNSFAEKCQHA